MTTLEALIRTFHQNPHEDTARLVLTDYLRDEMRDDAMADRLASLSGWAALFALRNFEPLKSEFLSQRTKGIIGYDMGESVPIKLMAMRYNAEDSFLDRCHCIFTTDRSTTWFFPSGPRTDRIQASRILGWDVSTIAVYSRGRVLIEFQTGPHGGTIEEFEGLCEIDEMRIQTQSEIQINFPITKVRS